MVNIVFVRSPLLFVLPFTPNDARSRIAKHCHVTHPFLHHSVQQMQETFQIRERNETDPKELVNFKQGCSCGRRFLNRRSEGVRFDNSTCNRLVFVGESVPFLL